MCLLHFHDDNAITFLQHFNFKSSKYLLSKAWAAVPYRKPVPAVDLKDFFVSIILDYDFRIVTERNLSSNSIAKMHYTDKTFLKNGESVSTETSF